MTEAPTLMKVKFARKGNHVHARVFTRTPPNETWASCGKLVFREEEWFNDMLVLFECGGAEVVKDES